MFANRSRCIQSALPVEAAVARLSLADSETMPAEYARCSGADRAP